jgi:hypothetical protein
MRATYPAGRDGCDVIELEGRSLRGRRGLPGRDGFGQRSVDLVVLGETARARLGEQGPATIVNLEDASGTGNE